MQDFNLNLAIGFLVTGSLFLFGLFKILLKLRLVFKKYRQKVL